MTLCNNKAIIIIKDTTGKLLGIVNDAMGVTPPIVSANVVTSHWLGQHLPGVDAHTRPRPVIVKFATTHMRDVVIRARRRWLECGDGPTLYVNEDPTHRRAALAKKTRELKKDKNHRLLDFQRKSPSKDYRRYRGGNPGRH